MVNIDKAILDLLKMGINTPRKLARELDVTQIYISQRLKALIEDGEIERIDRGEYEVMSTVEGKAPP